MPSQNTPKTDPIILAPFYSLNRCLRQEKPSSIGNLSKYGGISIQYLTYAIYECFSSSDKKQSICKKIIRELTEDDIYTFIQTILMDKDLSTKEYGNVKTVLQGMIRYARFEKKYTSINISNFFGDFRVGKNILKKSEKTDAQKCFTDEERIRILKLVDKKPDIRNLAIHLCFQTGVRVGELAALKWEDIDWENGTLHIQRIETRAFTQDTSTAKKKSYINNQRLLSI